MAIKGKTRTKSKPKQVARAPRREPVVVKPPVFARRGVQVVAAMLVAAFAVLVAVWVTNGLRQDSRDKAAASTAQSTGASERTAGLAWQSAVEGAITQVGTLSPPQPPQIFIDLNKAVDTMKKDNTVPKGAVRTFATADANAKKAVSALLNFDLATTIANKGFDVGGAEYFTESKDRLASAITTYQRAAEAALVAAKAPDADRKAMTGIADSLRSDANTELATAWSIYQSALSSAGIGTAAPGSSAGG